MAKRRCSGCMPAQPSRRWIGCSCSVAAVGPERGAMKQTEEVRIVLDIVRQVLRTRLDWVTQGQVLLEEILETAEKAPNSLKP